MKSPIGLVSVTSKNSLTYQRYYETIPINPELIKIVMFYAPKDKQLSRDQAIVFNRVYTWRSSSNNEKYNNHKYDLRADIPTLVKELNIPKQSIEKMMKIISKKGWWDRWNGWIRFNDNQHNEAINNAKKQGYEINDKERIKKTKFQTNDQRNDEKLSYGQRKKRDVSDM